MNETPQKEMVIGGVGVEKLRNGQDEGGQNPYRVGTVSFEDMAYADSGCRQVLVQNKRSEPEQGCSCD